MKLIYKTITADKQITQYKAYDGKIFDNSRDCHEYERPFRDKVDRMFKAMICLEATAEETNISQDDEEVMSFVIPANKKDLIVLNAINRWHSVNVEYTTDDIGKLIYYCYVDFRDDGILDVEYISTWRWDRYVDKWQSRWAELKHKAIENQMMINDGLLNE